MWEPLRKLGVSPECSRRLSWPCVKLLFMERVHGLVKDRQASIQTSHGRNTKAVDLASPWCCLVTPLTFLALESLVTEPLMALGLSLFPC